ncbi:hypothetical protein EMIT0194P_30384 [Pseudomonas serbica]
MRPIKTIYQPGVCPGPIIRPSSFSGASVMFINSLLCSLLAAYACGASGTCETPKREV